MIHLHRGRSPRTLGEPPGGYISRHRGKTSGGTAPPSIGSTATTPGACGSAEKKRRCDARFEDEKVVGRFPPPEANVADHGRNGFARRRPRGPVPPAGSRGRASALCVESERVFGRSPPPEANVADHGRNGFARRRPRGPVPPAGSRGRASAL